MRLLEVRLLHFRNFDRDEFRFDDGVNLICGGNGVGKSNLLEACAYLGNPRSFRRILDRDLVRWGDSFFRIEGVLGSKNVRKDVTVTYQNGSKEMQIDGKRATALDLFRTLVTLTLDMRDHRLIDGPPVSRRKMLDRFISSLDPEYLRGLMDYRRNLAQKNVLLRKGRNTRELRYWNANLERTGAVLVDRRERFVRELSDHFERQARGLLPSRSLTLRYEPMVRPEPGLFDRFAEEERRQGFAIYGPHRDRFDVRVDDRSPRAAASEGEKRLAILALYLSVREFLRGKLDTEPVLLLDEPFGILSESFIENLLRELRGQVILTALTPVLGLSPQIMLE
jgi:DNA replication and repair protein RecF